MRRGAKLLGVAQERLTLPSLLHVSVLSRPGYATSSVEGRISVEFLDPSSEAQAKKYAFKCHRVVVDGVDTVYPVNAMGYNPL